MQLTVLYSKNITYYNYVSADGIKKGFEYYKNGQYMKTLYNY